MRTKRPFNMSSIQFTAIRPFCPKKLDKKVDKIHKDFLTITTLYEQFSVLNCFNTF